MNSYVPVRDTQRLYNETYVRTYVHRCTIQFFKNKRVELDLLATKEEENAAINAARQIVLARGKF